MPVGYKKGKLRLPQIVRKAPLDIHKAFLIGFFDGDGYCSLPSARLCSSVVSVSQSSKEILEDLNKILLEAGLHFNLHLKKRGSYEWFVLESKSPIEIKKFHEEFGFRYAIKQENLRKLVEAF